MKQQIDYQQLKFNVTNSNTPTLIKIPIPINSVLKGFSVQRTRGENIGTNGLYQAVVYLSHLDEASNTRIDHHLASGSIGHGAYFNDTNEFFRWSISKILDHPIQKEGISLNVNVYNLTGSGGNVLVSTQIKNLEGVH